MALELIRSEIIRPTRQNPVRETYGLKWPDKYTGQFIDQVMYGSAEHRAEAGTEQWKHLQRLLEWRYPIGNKTFQMHWFVDELCWAWCNYDVIIIWGSGGTGKSDMLGVVPFEELEALRGKYSAMMSSTSLEALKHRSFGAAKKAFYASDSSKKWLKLTDSASVGKIVAQADYLKESGDKEAGIWCVPIARGDSGQKVKNQLGRHNENTRMLLDEANAEELDAAYLGYDNLQMTGKAKLVCAFNPSEWTSRVAALSMPKKGSRRDIEKAILNADMNDPECIKWECKSEEGWGKTIVLHFDARRNNSVLHPDGPAAGARQFGWMTSKENLDKMMPGNLPTKANHYTQIFACPPPDGLVDVVITPRQFAAGRASENPPTWISRSLSIVGGDPAYSGRDDPYMMRVQVGTGNVDGRERLIINVSKQQTLDPSISDEKKQFIRELARLYGDEIQAAGGPRYGVLDTSGTQKAFLEMVEEECGRGIYRCGAGESVGLKESGRDKVRAKKRPDKNDYVKLNPKSTDLANTEYADWTSYAYGLAANFIRAGHVRGLGREAERQLTTRMVLKSSPLKIQSKKSWSQSESPDEADTFAVICVALVERFGILPAQAEIPAELVRGLPSKAQVGEEVMAMFGYGPPKPKKSNRRSKFYKRKRGISRF